MFDLPWFNKYLMKHTAVIPKGFLRQYVIKLLSEKPMSGSEIIEEIWKRTEGLWKPSPGSIYPLLAWLRDKGFIKEVPSEERDVKRYSLTEKGKIFLKEQQKTLLEMGERFGSFKHSFRRMPPFPRPFIVPFLLSLCSGKMNELRETFKELFKALFELGSNLEWKYSDEAVKELKEAVEHLIDKIKEINEKLKE